MQKNTWENSKSIQNKNSQQTKNTRELSKPDKRYLWKTDEQHHICWWKTVFPLRSRIRQECLLSLHLFTIILKALWKTKAMQTEMEEKNCLIHDDMIVCKNSMESTKMQLNIYFRQRNLAQKEGVRFKNWEQRNW